MAMIAVPGEVFIRLTRIFCILPFLADEKLGKMMGTRVSGCR